MGASANEVPGLEGTLDHPAGRGIAAVGQTHAREAGRLAREVLPLGRAVPAVRRGRAGRPSVRPGPGQELGPGRGLRRGNRSGAGAAEAEPSGTGGDIDRRESPVHLGSIGVPAAAGERASDQPDLHRDEGGRRDQRQDVGAQPALANGLHLPEGALVVLTTQ